MPPLRFPLPEPAQPQAPTSAWGTPRTLAILVAGSATFGLLILANNYALDLAFGGVFTWRKAVISLSRGAEWVVVAPVLVAFLRRFPPTGGRWLPLLCIYGAVGLGLHSLTEVAHTGLAFAIGYAGAMEPAAFYWSSWKNAALLHVISYLAVGGAVYGYDQHARALRLLSAHRAREIREAHLESELAQAQLHALRMQINPHFLFNALSAASALTKTDPARARRTLADLGGLLRLALDTTEEEVPLRDELVFLDHYLRIEQARMGDRLRVCVLVGDDVLDALVPPLLLQPLVENAVKHGVAPLEGGGTIEVSGGRERGELVVTVYDSGRGLPASSSVPSRGGIGLQNVRRRLDRLHGGAATLTLLSGPAGGLSVIVRLPFRTARGMVQVPPAQVLPA